MGDGDPRLETPLGSPCNEKQTLGSGPLHSGAQKPERGADGINRTRTIAGNLRAWLSLLASQGKDKVAKVRNPPTVHRRWTRDSKQHSQLEETTENVTTATMQYIIYRSLTQRVKRIAEEQEWWDAL